MQRLISDLLYRSRWRSIFFLLFVGGLLWISVQMGEPARAFAISMGYGFGMGPQLTLRYVPRSIWYRPVSRRDIWRAGWLVATVGTTASLLAVKLIVMMVLLVTPTFDMPGVVPVLTFAKVALSSVYDLAACGVGCALVTLLTRPQPHGPLRHLSSLVRGLAEIFIQIGFFAAWYGGVFGHARIPTDWNHLTVTSGLFLAGGLALTIATYFHSPVPPPLARAQAQASRGRQVTAAAPAGLSGLPRLLAHEYRWAMLIGAGLAFLSVLAAMVIARFTPSRDILADLVRTELRFLDGTFAAPASTGLDALGALIWYGFFIGSLAARFPAMLRHLRVLPISAARMNLLSAGLILFGAASLVLGEIVPARMPVLLALAGLSALAGALTLRVTGIQRIFLLCVAVGLVPILHAFPVPQSSTLALVGAGALALAAVLNHITLRRSSTYRISHSELAAASARFGL
jgi:hypothetical protein